MAPPTVAALPCLRACPPAEHPWAWRARQQNKPVRVSCSPVHTTRARRADVGLTAPSGRRMTPLGMGEAASQL
eukprot:14033880-Alexandrium_andersonii.AAC.1